MKKTSRNSKANMIVKLYEQPIYPIKKLYVVYNYNIKALNKLFHDNENIPITEEEIDRYAAVTFSGLYDKHGDPCVVIVIKDTTDFVNTSAHEAVHVANRVLKCSADLPFTSDTQEAYAYFIGWVTDCIYKTIKRK